MYDPDLHTWGEDGDRLARDAEIDGVVPVDHVPWFFSNLDECFSHMSCSCGVVSDTLDDAINHLREVLNP